MIRSRIKVYKRDKRLKISKDTTIKVTDTSHTTNLKPNVIKQATKEGRREMLHKQVGIDEANIVSTIVLHQQREEGNGHIKLVSNH